MPVTHPPVPPRIRSARIAVILLFFANGTIGSSMLPRLPAIKDALNLTNAELGLAVAALPVGGLLAGGFAGIFVARFGSGRVAWVAGLGAAAALVAIGVAGSWAALAAAFLVLGMFDASMDAAMNAHGIGVERQYGRSILQGFHGMWSAGAMTAGALGAVAAVLAVPVSVNLAAAAGLAVLCVVMASRRVLPTAIADARLPGDDAPTELMHVRNAPMLLRVLVPIAMLGILAAVLQSAAATWSAVYLTDVLGEPAGVAAIAFVAYTGAMMVSRLTNDRWIDRFGRVPVVRVGAAIGATGVALAIVSALLGAPALALLGFAAVGAGSSSMFPVMAATAGSIPGIPAGYGVALVSWMVRFGLMVAPAAVGVAADAAGLTVAFLIPFAAAATIGLLAPFMIGARRRGARAEAGTAAA